MDAGTAPQPPFHCRGCRMTREIRVILEMAARVFNWCKVHLDPSERFIALMDRLGFLLTRADALVVQQVNGKAASSKAVRRRKEVVRALRVGPLKHLVRIARTAAARLPGLDKHFSLPRDGASQKVVLAQVRSMVAEVEKEKALFQEYGLSDDVLGSITALLAEYEQALEAGDAGRRAHTGARVDLEEVTDEIMQVIRDLDAMQRLRYRNEPEQLGSWQSARNVPWRASAPPATPEEGSTGSAA